jgi:hypothetical protein
MGQAVSDHNTKMITLTELRITKSLLSIHIHTWRVLLKLHKCDNIIWLIILSLLTLRAQTVQGILHLLIKVKKFLLLFYLEPPKIYPDFRHFFDLSLPSWHKKILQELWCLEPKHEILWQPKQVLTLSD